MNQLDQLIAKLRTPCGRSTGHGESCVRGYSCSACAEKAKAADVIAYLAKEVVELRQQIQEMKK